MLVHETITTDAMQETYKTIQCCWIIEELLCADDIPPGFCAFISNGLDQIIFDEKGGDGDGVWSWMGNVFGHQPVNNCRACRQNKIRIWLRSALRLTKIAIHSIKDQNWLMCMGSWPQTFVSPVRRKSCSASVSMSISDGKGVNHQEIFLQPHFQRMVRPSLNGCRGNALFKYSIGRQFSYTNKYYSLAIKGWKIYLKVD